MIKIDETLKSALIRKDVKEIYAMLLDNNEMTEQAQEVRDASRFTKALVDRTCPKVEEVVAEEAIAEEAPITVGDIKALVASGKKKHLKAAKKAFKAQFSKEHPNYKELKQLIKEA